MTDVAQILAELDAESADLDLTAQGPAAHRWLDVAQAFAGPPGRGRHPSTGVTA